MKKIISVFLTIAIVFSLVGCMPNPSDTTTNPDKTQKAELSRGKIEGDVYKNEYLGFEFTKPASWIYSTDEEVAALLNMAAETLISDNNFKEALENNPAIYDMMVVDSISRSNINVGYENLSKSFSTNITEKQYAEVLRNQLTSVTTIDYTFSDTYDTVKLGETEFTRWTCYATANGITMTQVYYLHKIDGYMGFVIVTIMDSHSISDIEAMFH